jgi:hypothetical protein
MASRMAAPELVARKKAEDLKMLRKNLIENWLF